MGIADALGGIGKGVMIGADQIRQQEAHDAERRNREEALSLQRQQLESTNKFRESQLGMQKESHGVQMDAAKRLQADQELSDWLNQQYRDIYSRTDLDDWGKASTFAQSILPKAKAEHIDAANKAAEGMRQKFGVAAVEQLKGGDVSGIQRILAQRAPGTTIKAGNGAYEIVGADGKVLQSIDRNGLMSMLALSDAYNQEAARAKAKIEADNKAADTAAKNSIAYKNRMLPFGVRGAGSSSSAGTGASRAAKAPDWLKMAGDVAPMDPTTQKGDPGAVSRIASSAESIYQSNPKLRETESPALALQVARGIETGELKPEPMRNEATNTYSKGVRFGAGMINVGGAGDIDPMLFYGNLPPEQQKAEQQKVIENDRQWLAGMLANLPQDQRDDMAQAVASVRADARTDQGAAIRDQIIGDVQKFRAARMPLPAELAIKYSALQTATRLDKYGALAAATVNKPGQPGVRGESVTREDIERQERIQRERSAKAISANEKEVAEARARRLEQIAQREREAALVNAMSRR